MSIPSIDAVSPLNVKRTIETFSTSDVSSTFSSGSMEDMMMKAMSNVAKENTQINSDLDATLASDLGSPFNMYRMEYTGAKKAMLFNFVTSVVGKIPKALEILNK